MSQRTRHTANIGGIEVIIEERDCFRAFIGSETLGQYKGAEAVVINDRESAPQKISYKFSDNRTTINADLVLRPGHNQIRIKLYGKSQIQDAEGIMDVRLEGRAYTSKGIEFLMEGQSKNVPNAALEEICELITSMNQLLSKPISELYIIDKEEPHGSATGESIELSRYNFGNEDRNPTAIAWHELAHLFYDDLRGPVDEYLRDNTWKPYGVKFEALFEEAVSISLVDNKDRINRPWKDIKQNSVMTLFSSHQYRGIDAGGPQIHSGELFAYGAEVLRYYPDKFKEKVQQLGTPEEKELAFQIAGIIASAYITNANCPSGLNMMRKFVQ